MAKEKIKKFYVIGNPDKVITSVKIKKLPKRRFGFYKGKGIKADIIFNTGD